MSVGGAVSNKKFNPAWAGVAFFVLYVAGMVLVGKPPKDSDKDSVKHDPAKLAAVWRTYYTDASNRWITIIGAFLLAASALAIVVFASEFRQRMHDGGARRACLLAYSSSLIFSAVTLAGAVGMAWIPASKQFSDVALPTGDINYLSNQFGYGLLLLAGGAAAALMLVAAGHGSMTAGVLPAWLGWAGVVSGVIVFFVAVLFIPMVLLVLWVLAASIVMIKRPGPAVVP